jgi:hypothetical protein
MAASRRCKELFSLRGKYYLNWQGKLDVGMSAVGYKETSSGPKSMSALPPKADILVAIIDFRL